MGKYNCSQCKYTTEYKSNLNKHFRRIHSTETVQNMSELNPVSTIEIKKEFICQYCNLKCSRKSNLTRHQQVCSEKKIDTIKKEYEDKLKIRELEIKNQIIEKENNELKSFIKSGKSGNTYKLSVKNYVDKNYPNAPALKGITDYDLLRYDDEEGTYDDEDEFMDKLYYNYKYNTLHIYLGKFIIKCYKKENPKEQSIWSSDVARLTYFIKELMINNKSKWICDKNAVKVREYIVDPLLKHLQKTILEYRNKKLKSVLKEYKRTGDSDILEKQTMLHGLIKVEEQIIHQELANNIVKYITPRFTIKKESNKSEPLLIQ